MKRRKDLSGIEAVAGVYQPKRELLALDLSTSETGYCIGRDKPMIWGVIKPKGDLEKRISSICAEVGAIGGDDIVAEALHYARGFKTVRALFMLHGAVQQTLYPKLISWVSQQVAHSQLGLGKVSKDKKKVLAFVNKLGYKTQNDNEADAILIWLAARGLQ